MLKFCSEVVVVLRVDKEKGTPLRGHTSESVDADVEQATLISRNGESAQKISSNVKNASTKEKW